MKHDMNYTHWMAWALLALTVPVAAQQSASRPERKQADAGTRERLTARSNRDSSSQPYSSLTPPITMGQVVDRVIVRENDLIKYLSSRTPMVETYLQDLTQDVELGPTPQDDRYFLGRMDLTDSVDRKDYLLEKSKDRGIERLWGGITKKFSFQYRPLGFSWMIFADRNNFDRQHYSFQYVRREFLGDVRCLVFDLTPTRNAGHGRFLGRIWVEDQDYSIVRLKGTYSHSSSANTYFHTDSWRLNVVPGYWVPAYIYTEEGDFSAAAKSKFAFKAQTRLWGYNLKDETHNDEFTQIRIESVTDNTPTELDASPQVAEREWQQLAASNVLERLQRAGLLAPEGDVDKVLQTVVNNIEVTNNIDLRVRARVLTTSPLETFSVGNTIVLSRGLIDVLPDEASLAAMLAHELAHIILGHNLENKYAFTDRMSFSDEVTYQKLGFKHIPEEEAAADEKAIELLKTSPYAAKLESAGLFIKCLQARAPKLSALLHAHLGNNLTENGTVTRMAALRDLAPPLDWLKLDQIAALPLGGRVKLNPWDDRAEMVKTQPLAIISVRDKMPFEVTPFYPRISRYNLAAPSTPIMETAATR